MGCVEFLTSALFKHGHQSSVRIYASMARSVTFTSIYTSFIIGQFLFSIASGTLCLYVLFNNAHAWDAARCLAIAFDLFTENLCQRTLVFKSLAAGFLGTLWMIEIGMWAKERFHC
jgi:hypothetical protein